jgi:GT2 family glycosyltransferase
MQQPRVLVGAPISDHHEYCWETFVQTLKNLTYPHIEILLIDNSKEERFYKKVKKDFPVERIPYHPDVRVRLAQSRNILREKAVREKFDYMYNLDQDVVPPKEVIERLLHHKKQIVTGVYWNKFTKIGQKNLTYETRLCPVLWVKSKEDPEKLVFVRKEVIEQNKLIRVDLCGTGCILIATEVLKKISFRYEKQESGVDDSFFCIDAAKLGYNIYADTSIKCVHHVDKRPISWGAKDL